MKTERSDKDSMDIRNNLFGIIPRMGKYLIPNDRHVFVLAIAASISITFTATLIGCSSTGKPHKYTGEQWERLKYNGHRSGNQ